jgi:hypothetical protein
MRLILILLPLGSNWGRGGSSPIRDVAYRLTTGIGYDVACGLTRGLLRCSWICFLLTTHSSCGISIFSLLALLICLTSLRRYVGRDHEDLLIRDLEHVTQVVGRDGHTSDLERDIVRGRLTVDLAVMSHDEMLMKLLEHTALASRVFGVLVDGARVVKITSIVSTMWDLGSRFDLDLVLHVARRCMSYVPQTKRHAG